MNGDLVITSAEFRRDIGSGAGLVDADGCEKDNHDTIYGKTTLVMTFPPGELAELRRLMWGEP